MKDIPAAAKKGGKKERQRDKFDPPLPDAGKKKVPIFVPHQEPEVRAHRKQEEYGPKKFIKP